MTNPQEPGSVRSLAELSQSLGLSISTLEAFGVQQRDPQSADASSKDPPGTDGVVEPQWGVPVMDRLGQRVDWLPIYPTSGSASSPRRANGIVAPVGQSHDDPVLTIVETLKEGLCLFEGGARVAVVPTASDGFELVPEAHPGVNKILLAGCAHPDQEQKRLETSWARWLGPVVKRVWKGVEVLSVAPSSPNQSLAEYANQLRACDVGSNDVRLSEFLLREASGIEGDSADYGLEVHCIEDVQEQQLEWHWKQRIPKGKFVVVCGEPGVGKSLLIVSLTAHISTGTPWPEVVPPPIPSGVLLLAAEDGVADTIKPRLRAAHADLRRVHVIESVKTADGGREFSFQEDLLRLETFLESSPDIQIVFVDPLNSFLGDANPNDNMEVRKITNGLTALAERTGVTIVGLFHLSKNSDRSVGNRVLGAISWTGAARMVYLVGKHPTVTSKAVLMMIKSNCTPPMPPIVFEIKGGDNPQLAWLAEEFDGDPDDLVSRPRGKKETKIEMAEAFLRDELAKGPMSASTVLENAKRIGVSSRTLERAAKNIEVQKSGGADSQWSLPSD